MACIGAKLGRPDNLVVGVVGDYSFEFLMEEIAVAVQHQVPYVLVMLNNGYMSLIRQPEKYNDARVPALVEIIVEREVDAAMGTSIDNINEYEPIEEGDRDLSPHYADNIPERD